LIRIRLLARVSTCKQELDNQERELRAWAATVLDSRVDHVYATVVSGGAVERADLNEIREDAAHHRMDLLGVRAMDRLTRGGPGPLLSILSELEGNGVAVFSLQEPFLSTMGESRDLMLALLGWVAKWQRQQIGANTKAGLARNRALVGGKLPTRGKDKRPRVRTCFRKRVV
jgi:DNA invertase Pin-like site-specific DNA recombinase